MRRTVYGCKGEAIPGTGTFVGPAGVRKPDKQFRVVRFVRNVPGAKGNLH